MKEMSLTWEEKLFKTGNWDQRSGDSNRLRLTHSISRYICHKIRFAFQVKLKAIEDKL